VGRLVRLRGKNEAEVAVVVSDRCQNRGLGIELLRRAVGIARDEKLSRVSAEMLSDNLKVRSIFKKLGFSLHMPGDFSSITAVLDL
jgi:acetyltransferase